MFFKLTTLEQVQEYLNSIDNINVGGCGISALSIYRWLREHGKMTELPKFVFIYNRETGYLNNSLVLKNNEGKPVAPTHCGLLDRGKFIDSEGQCHIGEYSWVQIIDEEEFIKRSIKEGKWNTSFDRDNIKKIEKKLEIDLSDIKKEKQEIK